MTDKNLVLGGMLYEGKAKQVFTAGDGDLVLIHFKDDATAFNGEKKGQIENKGVINNRLSARFFRYLETEGIPTHFVALINDRDMLCRRVEIIPLEVIVRNIVAGSLAKRTNQAEGTELGEPLVELTCKDDARGDPLVTKEEAIAMGAASTEEIDRIRTLALQVNEKLLPFLLEKKLKLVDFKLEFGRDRDGNLLLADEISPDTCRFWDTETGEKLDKDRFRRDLGGVKEAYIEVWNRIGDFRSSET
ncbi:MAG: phosphoribosylaminoimidazolesuccinocarboxamide synthase [Treponema sp.]|jgi:phosphoribosylaminoimidazole-succinocarboxamide synthase|nr:phosphoribosylaminoimidazolesuccinocarboxamide synthase [Treponema sp.]